LINEFILIRAVFIATFHSAIQAGSAAISLQSNIKCIPISMCTISHFLFPHSYFYQCPYKTYFLANKIYNSVVVVADSVMWCFVTAVGGVHEINLFYLSSYSNRELLQSGMYKIMVIVLAQFIYIQAYICACTHIHACWHTYVHTHAQTHTEPLWLPRFSSLLSYYDYCRFSEHH